MCIVAGSGSTIVGSTATVGGPVGCGCGFRVAPMGFDCGAVAGSGSGGSDEGGWICVFGVIRGIGVGVT
jgi:hypothetical protein